MIIQETAEALIAAATDRIEVEPIQVEQVVDLLRASGRYGSEAPEVVTDVLAALHVVKHGAKLEDWPRNQLP